MTRAVLIAGDEDRFVSDIDLMRRYLDGLCASGAEIVMDVLRADDMSMPELEDSLSLALCMHAEEPLLLLYAGHGVRGAWAPMSGQRMPYRRLAAMLRDRIGPFLFINSCCHSGSVFSALEASGVPKFRTSVIASSPGEKVSYGGLVDRVLGSWENGRPHEPVSDDGRTEYIGAIYSTEPTVREEIRDDGRGGTTRVQVVSFPDMAPWWWRLRIRAKVAWHRWFPLVNPWNIVEERRWGAVLDHHFIAPRRE